MAGMTRDERLRRVIIAADSLSTYASRLETVIADSGDEEERELLIEAQQLLIETRGKLLQVRERLNRSIF